MKDSLRAEFRKVNGRNKHAAALAACCGLRNRHADFLILAEDFFPGAGSEASP